MKNRCINCYVLLYRIILCNVYRFKFTSGYPKTIHESIHSVKHLIIRVVDNTETRFVFSSIQICILKSVEKKRYIYALTRTSIRSVEYVIARVAQVQLHNARSFIRSLEYSRDPIE